MDNFKCEIFLALITGKISVKNPNFVVAKSLFLEFRAAVVEHVLALPLGQSTPTATKKTSATDQIAKRINHAKATGYSILLHI